MKRAKNSPRQDRTIDEGMRAARDGNGADDCPYQFQIIDRAAWFIGWERGGGNMRTGKVERNEGTDEIRHSDGTHD